MRVNIMLARGNLLNLSKVKAERLKCMYLLVLLQTCIP